MLGSGRPGFKAARDGWFMSSMTEDGFGGFLGLELPRGRAEPHPGALALTSGRACLRLALEILRPALLQVPHYACDVVTEVATRVGVPVRRYAIEEDLSPRTADLGGEGALLLVDYFGLGPAVPAFDGPSIHDCTQAFFVEASPGQWVFNSARKFFGVPDGAYLYGPGVLDVHPGPAPPPRVDHLVSKLEGQQALAFQQYRAGESEVSVEVRSMSEVSRRLLALVDHPAVIRRRQENYRRLHQNLGAANELVMAHRDLDGRVPLCYPFLPSRRIERTALHARKIYVPTFWPEFLERAPPGLAVESRLARELLPLPIDHRYTESDMDGMSEIVMSS